jgi:putative DNA primase/helicase
MSMKTTSTFKQIVGGDSILVEKKHQQPFSYRPFARLLFSTNFYPQVAEATASFYARWVVVPFTRVHRGGASEINQDEMDKRLSDPTELSGLLNKALDGLRRIKENEHLTESPKMVAAKGDFRAESDPLGAFLDLHLIHDGTATVPKEEVRQRYNVWRLERGLGEETKVAFGKAMAVRKLGGGQPLRDDGTRLRVFSGCRLAPAA